MRDFITNTVAIKLMTARAPTAIPMVAVVGNPEFVGSVFATGAGETMLAGEVIKEELSVGIVGIAFDDDDDKEIEIVV